MTLSVVAETPAPVPHAVYFDGKWTLYADYDTALSGARTTASENPDKLVRLYKPVIDLRATLEVREEKV